MKMKSEIDRDNPNNDKRKDTDYGKFYNSNEPNQ
jgi:hypothetical protein